MSDTPATPTPSQTGAQPTQVTDPPAQPTQVTDPPAQPTQPTPNSADDGTQGAEPQILKPEDYVLPDGLPDTVRQFAATHKFTQEQLNAALQEFGGYMTGIRQAEIQQLRQAGEQYVKNWGDSAKTNLSLAKRALKQNDPTGALTKALNESGYGNHPAVIEFLYNIGKSMQEGGFLKGTIQKPVGQKTAAQAMYGENHPSKES